MMSLGWNNKTWRPLRVRYDIALVMQRFELGVWDVERRGMLCTDCDGGVEYCSIVQTIDTFK